ncbi:hypothetical protein FQN54_000416 [Arachnomyces sp. PD_36]|nr:hypothetical protein FQN54_000416 [Arachnomyces sp. PD_36]
MDLTEYLAALTPRSTPTPTSRSRSRHNQPTPQTTIKRIQTRTLTSSTSPSTLPSQIRTLMRLVPHPVSIITSTSTSTTSPSSSPYRGMTVSSFNTVTLSPIPIVSFNVKTPSETLNAIHSSGRFAVHLLAPKEGTAGLARLFSGGSEGLVDVGEKEGEGGFEFCPAPEGETETGEPPILKLKGSGSEVSDMEVDFPFILQCEYLPQSVSVGDHMVVLGKVVRVHTHPGLLESGGSEKKKELCLTYADTKFWKMGEEVDISSTKTESSSRSK